MKMNTHTLLLTMDDITQLTSILGNTDEGFTLTYQLGRIKKFDLLDNVILVLKFQNAELRLNLTKTDLEQIKDDMGNLIFNGDKK